MIDAATIFAWLVMTVLFLVLVACIVAIGSLPKRIADKRGHPQADAINAASWVGLFFGGIGWFFAFVWAYTRPRPAGPTATSASPDEAIQRLEARIRSLENQLAKPRK